jgi:PilZ domain
MTRDLADYCEAGPVMAYDKRKADRIRFEFGYLAAITAIDGTWERKCHIVDVSPTGARLMVDGDIEALQLTEFFLVLSRTGQAHRRCKLIWVKGDNMGVSFLHGTAENAGRAKRRWKFEDQRAGE